MLFDMLSTDMYVSFNCKLAQRIGLHTAIYVTELLNISRKAYLKGKLYNEKFFKIDRAYIEERTTLPRKEQRELDEILVNLNILQIDESSKDLLCVDADALTGVLLDDRKTVEAKIKPIVKRKRSSKKEEVTLALKNRIETDNPELKAAYEEWIDAVMARQGWMTAAAVVEAQKVIDRYTNKDLDLALELLKIATINGLRDINWAINDFEKEYKKRYQAPQILQPNIPIERSQIEFSDEEY